MAARITITLTQTELQAIGKIMDRYGLKTKSDAISLAVTDYLNARESADEMYKTAMKLLSTSHSPQA